MQIFFIFICLGFEIYVFRDFCLHPDMMEVNGNLFVHEKQPFQTWFERTIHDQVCKHLIKFRSAYLHLYYKYKVQYEFSKYEVHDTI